MDSHEILATVRWERLFAANVVQWDRQRSSVRAVSSRSDAVIASGERADKLDILHVRIISPRAFSSVAVGFGHNVARVVALKVTSGLRIGAITFKTEGVDEVDWVLRGISVEIFLSREKPQRVLI
jgi:hypothetical protein